METNDTYQPIVKQVKQYLATRYKLLKLEAINEGTSFVSGIITDVVMIVSFIVAFVFFTLTLAYFLGIVMGSNWMGFGCVTLFYLFIAIIHRVFKTCIENMLVRTLVQRLFKHKNNIPGDK